MEYRLITATKDESGQIATVTLNRPERLNAWEDGMTPEVANAFTEFGADPDVRAIVFTGAGRAFCAGADLKNEKTHKLGLDALDERIASTSQGAMPAFDAIQKNPKPIITAVNGYSLGVGFLVTLCTDILIASEHAVFGLPQVGLGVFPAYGGPKRLMRFVSKPVASEMIMMSHKIGAEDALRWGLVNRVVPHEQLMDTAYSFAEEFTKLPPLSVKLAKESINESADIASLQQAATADRMRTTLLQMTKETHRRHDSWRSDRSGT